jgi:hypothetical protein
MEAESDGDFVGFEVSGSESSAACGNRFEGLETLFEVSRG